MVHTETGIWSQGAADAYHQSSPQLAAWLARYLKNCFRVVDLGCGTGYYCQYLEDDHNILCRGVDGNIEAIKHHRRTQRDLTQPLNWFFNYCAVLSLEVGEHLPASAQETFMQNITAHCTKHLILSWAEIGQPGIGHVNCRSQEDVIADVEARGFRLNQTATADARNNIDDNCNWFRKTLLVFDRV